VRSYIEGAASTAEIEMFSERVGVLLKHARKQLNLSRGELADRAGVSTRLVAELERGQRPNVSLESALKLLNLVGVSLNATGASGATAESANASHEQQRAARAARRRQSWTGRQIHLHDEGDDPRPARSKAKRLSAVSQVSRQAYLIAGAGRVKDDYSTVHSPSAVERRRDKPRQRSARSRPTRSRSGR
jgi:transcriptional regulator with XRE-family HTH domain